MTVWKAARTQLQIGQACLRLNAPDESERYQAVQTLCENGSASLPPLQLALRAQNSPRARIAACVALHRIGSPLGIKTLMEMLAVRTFLPLAPDLETAFLRIGPPDAVNALLLFWKHETNWHESNPALELICRVWATLRDPRVLESLCEKAHFLPALFEQTVPPFGEMAIPHLLRITKEPSPERRILAVQTLAHIPGINSFKLLIPLLRDEEPKVRAAVPAAMEKVGGGPVTVNALTAALDEGFSSQEGIETLLRLKPVPYASLLALIQRWNPQTLTPRGDSGGAVLAALPALAYVPLSLPAEHIVRALCELVERKPGRSLACAIARTFAARGKTDPASDARAVQSLYRLMTYPTPEVREEAAKALTILGDETGKRLNQILHDSRPQDSLRNRVQTILRGGQDAGQVASQALQQVSQWVSRVSREAVERLASGPNVSQMVAEESDSRLAGTVRELLDNALEWLKRAETDEIETLLPVTVAAIRALVRTGAAYPEIVHRSLLKAFYAVRLCNVGEGGANGTFQKTSLRDIGALVRSAAAEALFRVYDTNAFPLFLEAAYAPMQEVRGTAIAALGQLGDARALPHLQRIAADPLHPQSGTAADAINVIKRINPEMMVLLRASSASESRPETLLRPAMGYVGETAPDQLLRPSGPNTPPEPA